MTTIYIAGPMTGLPNYNHEAFAHVAAELRSWDNAVLSPHEINDGTEDAHPWEWYMRRALQLLLDADMVVLLPGWQKSRGASAEHYVAELLGMPILEWLGATA